MFKNRILMEANFWKFDHHRPSLRSRDVPQKIWARSVKPFWRLLDTNKQTPRQAKFIYRLTYCNSDEIQVFFIKTIKSRYICKRMFLSLKKEDWLPCVTIFLTPRNKERWKNNDCLSFSGLVLKYNKINYLCPVSCVLCPPFYYKKKGTVH